MFENGEKWIFCFVIREIENLLSWLRDKTPPPCPPSYNWHPFYMYEARFGTEIFVELNDSTLSSPVSSYMLERYITSYFIAFTIVVYCYYGYLPIS